MNPFITCWDGPFAGEEKSVFDICLHGLNNDRARGPIDPRSFWYFPCGVTEVIHPCLGFQEGNHGSV